MIYRFFEILTNFISSTGPERVSNFVVWGAFAGLVFSFAAMFWAACSEVKNNESEDDEA